MKRPLFLSLALILISSSVYLFTTNALGTSANAQFWKTYYSYPKVEYSGTRTAHYTSSRAGGYRYFSGRIGPYQYRQPTISQSRLNDYNFSNPTRRHDMSYYSDYAVATQSYRKTIEQFRASHPDLYPRYENTISSDKIVVRNGNYVQISLDTDKPNKVVRVSVQEKNNQAKRDVLQKQSQDFYFPQQNNSATSYSFDAYSFNEEDTDFYVSKNSSLSFHVSRRPSCQSNFEQCATDLGKNFKDSHQLVQVSQIFRELRWKKPLASTFRFYTFTESFHANTGDNQNVYFIFNTLDPQDGSVVRIEAVADAKETKRASGIMLSIFDSFYFIN